MMGAGDCMLARASGQVRQLARFSVPQFAHFNLPLSHRRLIVYHDRPTSAAACFNVRTYAITDLDEVIPVA